MGAEGGFRTWLTEGKVAAKPAYLSAEVSIPRVFFHYEHLNYANSEQDISYQLEEFSTKNGGYGPSINWYKASLQNINAADEKGM